MNPTRRVLLQPSDRSLLHLHDDQLVRRNLWPKMILLIRRSQQRKQRIVETSTREPPRSRGTEVVQLLLQMHLLAFRYLAS